MRCLKVGKFLLILLTLYGAEKSRGWKRMLILNKVYKMLEIFNNY